MPALVSATIHGFKSIASIEKLPVGPVNVLIGANGSGKSNFLAAFALLNAIRTGGLQRYVAEAGGAERLLHFGSKTTSELLIDVTFEDKRPGHWSSYAVALTAGATDSLLVSSERTSHPSAGTTRETTHTSYPRGEESQLSRDREPPPFIREMDRWRVYHFQDTGSTSPMKKTSNLHDNRYLRTDGGNLAAFLYLLRERHQPEYDFIRRTARRVAPFFDDFVLQPLLLNPETIRLEWRHAGSDQYFDAAALSDGTLRFIALATLLLQPDGLKPSVILIDEPEIGLHPAAVTLLASLVKMAAKHSRVLLATQSPTLLDYFDPEDVLVAEREAGGTILRRLEAAPLEDWLARYSLGELWEKNEIGGRPAVEV